MDCILQALATQCSPAAVLAVADAAVQVLRSSITTDERLVKALCTSRPFSPEFYLGSPPTGNFSRGKSGSKGRTSGRNERVDMVESRQQRLRCISLRARVLALSGDLARSLMLAKQLRDEGGGTSAVSMLLDVAVSGPALSAGHGNAQSDHQNVSLLSSAQSLSTSEVGTGRDLPSSEIVRECKQMLTEAASATETGRV